ncbi:hypothetical protein DSO57_1037818 [Entomophthora muscae]|uniref:Uncharacterized protein n=1 Tax=Entomophthora muscae TaxID=34485 RepID=A0ACC2SZ91_9FUNG|nr:hypothetical protein DSO57_1037818 [Entomophthora muscae]
MEIFTLPELRYSSENNRTKGWFDAKNPLFSHDFGMLNEALQISSTNSQSSRSGPSTPEQSPESKSHMDLRKLESSYAALKERNTELIAELDHTKAITQTLRYIVASKDEEIKKMLLPKAIHNLPPIKCRKSSPANRTSH